MEVGKRWVRDYDKACASREHGVEIERENVGPGGGGTGTVFFSTNTSVSFPQKTTDLSVCRHKTHFLMELKGHDHW